MGLFKASFYAAMLALSATGFRPRKVFGASGLIEREKNADDGSARRLREQGRIRKFMGPMATVSSQGIKTSRARLGTLAEKSFAGLD